MFHILIGHMFRRTYIIMKMLDLMSRLFSLWVKFRVYTLFTFIQKSLVYTEYLIPPTCLSWVSEFTCTSQISQWKVLFWSPVEDSDGAAILALTPVLGKDLIAPSPLRASSIVLCLVPKHRWRHVRQTRVILSPCELNVTIRRLLFSPLLWAWSWEAELTATLQREQYRRRFAFSSSVSISGPSTSFSAPLSDAPGLDGREFTQGSFKPSEQLLFDDAVSEVGFSAETLKINKQSKNKVERYSITERPGKKQSRKTTTTTTTYLYSPGNSQSTFTTQSS